MKVSTDYWVAIATVAPILLLAATASTREMAKPKNVGKAWAVWVGASFGVVVLVNVFIEVWALVRLAGILKDTDKYWRVAAVAIGFSFVVVGIWGMAPYFNMYKIFFGKIAEAPRKYDVKLSFPDPRADIHIEVASPEEGVHSKRKSTE